MPITPTKHIWMNGELVPWEDAKIHVLSHSLHYGTGVFEGIRAYATDDGPAVFRLTDHIQRLYNSGQDPQHGYAVLGAGDRGGLQAGGARQRAARVLCAPHRLLRLRAR